MTSRNKKNVDADCNRSKPACEFLILDDQALLAQCEIHIYKASGPGGQHRNKVSSAIRLHHKPSGITATANDSRSQHDNKKLAIKRMRMNLAVRLRGDYCFGSQQIPAVLRECIFVPKKSNSQAGHKLELGRKDFRFWTVAAILLDMLTSAGGQLSQVTAELGISTGNLTKFFKIDRHLIEAVQNIRKKFNLKPIN